MALSRLLYYSENQIVRGDSSVLNQLGQILSTSNRNNGAVGITGSLIFDDLWFMQVLEGDRAAVWRKFERIWQDERHANVVLVEMREVEERLFGNWWMGLAMHNARTHTAFAPHLKKGRLRPPEMSAAALLQLMIDVAKLGLSREVKAKAAAEFDFII